MVTLEDLKIDSYLYDFVNKIREAEALEHICLSGGLGENLVETVSFLPGSPWFIVSKTKFMIIDVTLHYFIRPLDPEFRSFMTLIAFMIKKRSYPNCNFDPRPSLGCSKIASCLIHRSCCRW